MESRFNYGIMGVLLIMSLLASCGDNTTNRLNLVQFNLNAIIWYVGLTTYPVTISSEPEGTINTNHGVVKIYTDDPYRSPDFVDKDQFPKIEP